MQSKDLKGWLNKYHIVLEEVAIVTSSSRRDISAAIEEAEAAADRSAA